MDLSNLVSTPLQEKKPYWEVLAEHRKVTGSDPLLADMSMPEFAKLANEATGTNQYDEGLHDNPIRRLSGLVDIGLHHFMGRDPDPTATNITGSLFHSLGVPEEGYDLPKLVGQAFGSGAEKLGADPETAQKIARVGEGAPRMFLDLALPGGVLKRGIPSLVGMMGTSALTTYGETGDPTKAAITAASIPLFGKAAELGGQLGLKAVGAPLLKDFRPDLLSKATALGGEEAASALGEQLVPKDVWQGLAKFTGSQTGMLATGIGTEIAQTVTDPNMTGEEKLRQVEDFFKPSSLIATGVAQLPFTAMDLVKPESRPAQNLEENYIKPMENAFKSQYRAETERLNYAQPSEVYLDSLIERLKSGNKTDPLPEQVGEVLSSMNISPISLDVKTPLKTADSTIDMQTAMDMTHTVAEKLSVARDLPAKLEPLRVYTWLRHFEQEGKLNGSDMVRAAAEHALNTYYQDTMGLDYVSPDHAEMVQRREQYDKEAQQRKAIDETIARKTRPLTDGGEPNPDRDPELIKRVTLVSGDTEHRLDLGITEPILIQTNPKAKPRPLTTSIIDSIRGLMVKKEASAPEQNAYDLSRATERLAEIDAEITDYETSKSKSSTDKGELEKLKAEQRILLERMGSMDAGGDIKETGQTRGEQLRAEATFAAHRAALDYDEPVDLSNPLSIGRFYNKIKGAIYKAELQANTNRDTENFVRDRDGMVVTRANRGEAEALAKSMTKEGSTFYVPKRARRDGTFPIIEKTFFQMPQEMWDPRQGTSRVTKLGEDMSMEQVAPSEYETGGIHEPETTGSPFDQLAETKNEITDQLAELDKITVPSIREAHKRIMVENLMQALTRMQPAQITEALQAALGPTEGGKPRAITLPSTIKGRVFAYLQFLRDGGDVKVTYEKKRAPLFLKTTSLEEAQQMQALHPEATITTEKVSGSQVNYMPAEGEEPLTLSAKPEETIYRVVGRSERNRLNIKGEGNLEALNNYMGEGMKFSDGANLNEPGVQKLNFFEQFHIITQMLRKEFVRPHTDEVDFRNRPVGDFGFYPTHLQDFLETRLLIDPKEYPTDKLISSSPKEWGVHKFGDPNNRPILEFTDTQGKTVRREVEEESNPLRTAIKLSTNDRLTMPAKKWVALFKEYAPEADARLMKTLETFVSHKFGAEIPVGFGVAYDPSNKGWYHFVRHLMQGTGIILSPYTPSKGGKYIVKLDAPHDIVGHLVEELAHAHTVFVYHSDPAIKAEVDRMFNHVKEHYDFLKQSGALGHFADDTFYSLSKPEEFIAGFFKDWRLHEFLKTIQDPFDPVQRPSKTRSLYDRVVEMFRRIFTSYLGPDSANTMLDRLSQVTENAMRVQNSMKGLTHKGDVYHELEKVGQRQAKGDLIYRPKSTLRDKVQFGTVYPLDIREPMPETMPPMKGPRASSLSEAMVKQKVEIAPEHKALLEWQGAQNALLEAGKVFKKETAKRKPNQERIDQALKAVEAARTLMENKKVQSDIATKDALARAEAAKIPPEQKPEVAGPPAYMAPRAPDYLHTVDVERIPYQILDAAKQRLELSQKELSESKDPAKALELQEKVKNAQSMVDVAQQRIEEKVPSAEPNLEQATRDWRASLVETNHAEYEFNYLAQKYPADHELVQQAQAKLAQAQQAEQVAEAAMSKAKSSLGSQGATNRLRAAELRLQYLEQKFPADKYPNSTPMLEKAREELAAAQQPQAQPEGEALASRVDPQPLIDSMHHASEYRTEEPDGIWHKPFSLEHFKKTFGPIVGDRLQTEDHAGQVGFKIRHVDLNNITESDLSQAPIPRVKPYGPTIYETLKSMWKQQGAGEQSAEAQATYAMRWAATLKGTDEALWGKIRSISADQSSLLLGIAWMPQKFGGISAYTLTQGLNKVGEVIAHEGAHLGGATNYVDTMPFEVRDAFDRVNKVYDQLGPDLRAVYIADLASFFKDPTGFNADAVNNKLEFAATFMEYMGKTLQDAPRPSAKLREMLRFLPDELSTLAARHTIARTQGLDMVKTWLTRDRTIAATGEKVTPKDIALMHSATDKMVEAFTDLSKPTVELSVKQAEFERMKSMYPQDYQRLVLQAADRMETTTGGDAEMSAYGFKSPGTEGEVLGSKITLDQLFKDVRKKFEYPEDGKFPTKMSPWMRSVAQFALVADKYPQLRPLYDMMASAQGLAHSALVEMQVIAAGQWTGNKLLNDTRTKQYGQFVESQRLRDIYSAMALDIQLDLKSKTTDAINAVLRKRPDLAENMDEVWKQIPDNGLEFKTSTYMDALYRKYHVTNPEDRATLDTIFNGTQKQIELTGFNIVRSHVMGLKTIATKFISKAMKISPEEARKIAELGYKAVELQNDPKANLQEALDTADQYLKLVPDVNVQTKLYQLFGDGQERIQNMARFLTLRSDSFMSERQFGDYAIWWRNADGRMLRKHFKDLEPMKSFIKNNDITPERTFYPEDKNFGVSEELYKTLDKFHANTMEKLKNLFGETEAEKYRVIMDIGTDLKNELSARDVLKVTTPRKGAASREYLDMFDVHQNYVTSVITAAKVKQMRMEGDLYLDQPEFDNEPGLKNYGQEHINATLRPDSKVGTFVSNINFMYYMAWNVANMVLEPFQQLTGLAPVLTKDGASIPRSYGLIADANKMFYEAFRNKGEYLDPEISTAVKRAQKEGVVDLGIFSELDHNEDLSLMNRIRRAGGLSEWDTFELLKNKIYQHSVMARRFYGKVPAYNSEIAFVAAYNHAKSKGLSGEAAYEQARFLKEKAMFGGGKMNRPGLFHADNPFTQGNRSAAQIMWSLQSYSAGMMTMMGHLIKDSVTKGLTPAQSAQTRKAALQMVATQWVLAGTLGMPFVQLGIVALQKLFPDENIELMVRQQLNKLEGDDKAFGGILSTMATTGLPSAFNYGPDVGSRLALSGTMGVSPYGDASLSNVVGPTASVVKNIFGALQAGAQGQPMQAVEDIMPRGLQRVWKTLEEGSMFRSTRGNVLADDLTLPEQVGRLVGFNPSRITKLRAADNLAKISEDAASHEQQGWVNRQVDSLKQGQDDVVHSEIMSRALEQKRNPNELARMVSGRYEDTTMPKDLKGIGDRSTLKAQNALQGVMGEQTPSPGYMDRVMLQMQLAQRMGFRTVNKSTVRKAATLDRLMAMYPQLSKVEAEAMLSRRATAEDFLEY